VYGFCCTVGHVVGCDLLGAYSNIEHVDSAIEEASFEDNLAPSINIKFTGRVSWFNRQRSVSHVKIALCIARFRERALLIDCGSCAKVCSWQKQSAYSLRETFFKSLEAS
jgi:hypothetical protein